MQISAAADVKQLETVGSDTGRGSTTAGMGGIVAVISHWQSGGENLKKRVNALNRTIQAIRSLGVPSKIVVATNGDFGYFNDLAVRHVAYPKPMCNKTFQSDLCLPWEAIKLLRVLSSRLVLEPDCWLEVMGACGPPSYDYYMYMEDDIEIPATTFNFWRKHVSHLYSRGFILSPLRVEPQTKLLSDCFDSFGSNCSGVTCPVVDTEGPSSSFLTAQEKIFVKMPNPYSASFLMNKEQFMDYLASREWDFDRSMTFIWGGVRAETMPLLHGLPFDPREGASSGLMGAYPPWGVRHQPITHPNMVVYHQVAMWGENKFFDNKHYDMLSAKVAPCVQDPVNCLSLSQIEQCPDNHGRSRWFLPLMPGAKPHWSKR